MSFASSVATDETSVAFFSQAHAAFLEAEQKPAATERFFRIGGLVVRLRFANSALAPKITPALEHLKTWSTPTPDLTVCLWDSASTGVESPSPPWTHGDYGVRNEIVGYNTERIRTAYHMGSGVLSVLDNDRRLAVFWIRDANELPIYESGAPLLTIFHWWMSTRGRHLIHAAAIGKEEGGVLLVGKGGSGKSSTALRSLNSDLLYAADDYCLLSNDGQPFVHSIYSSGKIHTKDTAHFPFLQPALDKSYNLNNEKALFFLNEAFGRQISAGFPIKAVFCPIVTGGATTKLRRIPPSTSLLALAPSTIFQLPGAGKEEFQFLSEIVRRVPGYALELGSDFDDIPRVIAEFLNTL